MAKNGKEIIWGGLTAAIAAAAGAQAAGAADADFTAPADDWSGLYLGVSVGVMEGDAPFDLFDDYEIENDVVFGGFVGYNVQMDSMVIGAELALQSGADTDNPGGSSDEYAINYIADAKFKLGVDMDSFMPYVFAGISGGELSNCCDDDYSFFGVNYGVGAEMMVTEQFSLGAEVLGRTIIEPYGGADDRSSASHFQGTLRAAFHF